VIMIKKNISGYYIALIIISLCFNSLCNE